MRNYVSRICTVGSVLMLAYTITSNYFIGGITPIKSIFSDPLTYIFTLAPIIVNTLYHLYKIIRIGFSGNEQMRYIVLPVIRVACILLELWLIHLFSLDTGLEINDDVATYGLKMLGLLIPILMECLISAYFDGDEIMDYFLREAGLSLLLLCFVNGCKQTTIWISTYGSPYPDENIVLVWIVMTIVYGILYALAAGFYMFFSIVSLIIAPLH